METGVSTHDIVHNENIVKFFHIDDYTQVNSRDRDMGVTLHSRHLQVPIQTHLEIAVADSL